MSIWRRRFTIIAAIAVAHFTRMGATLVLVVPLSNTGPVLAFKTLYTAYYLLALPLGANHFNSIFWAVALYALWSLVQAG